MLGFTLLVLHESRRFLLWTGYVATLALLANVKFSLFLLACLDVVAVFAWAVAARRWLTAVALPLGFALANVGVWVLVDQNLANLPVYLQGSTEIASGFGEAMALPGSTVMVALALAIVGLLAGYFRALPGRTIALLVLLGGSLFLQWKQGFARQDVGHVWSFFAYTVLVPFLLAAWLPVLPARQGIRRAFLFLAVLLSLVGLQISARASGDLGELAFVNLARVPDQLADGVTPKRLQNRLNASASVAPDEWFLPRIKARVRGRSVDLLSYAQGFLFLNTLTWNPRPVFQSYSAYTPKLARVNADHFLAAQAPDFVILALTPIDGRLPALEDGPALIEMLRLYRPVLVEKGLILLERQRREVPIVVPTTVLERTVRLNEPVAINGEPSSYQTLSVHVTPTLWGRVRAFLFRPEPVWIELTLADSRTLTFRFIPGMAEAGFLLNPLLVHNPDILKLYGAPGALRVRSCAIVSSDPSHAGYEDEVRVKLSALPGLIPQPLDGADLELLRDRP
jgi:hypothetical protein